MNRHIPESAIDFNVYLLDEQGDNRHKVDDVIAVELPKISFAGSSCLIGLTPARIFFSSVEGCIALARATETRLLIRAAEQSYSRETGNFDCKGREHSLTIDRATLCFTPGIVKQDKPAYACCEFLVKKYTMIFDGKEVLRAYG